MPSILNPKTVADTGQSPILLLLLYPSRRRLEDASPSLRPRPSPSAIGRLHGGEGPIERRRLLRMSIMALDLVRQGL